MSPAGLKLLPPSLVSNILLRRIKSTTCFKRFSFHKYEFYSIKDRDIQSIESIPIERVRNIGIIAHIDAGKTTTTERMLYYSGITKRMGDVDDGDTMMDYLPQERERGITITSATITFPWKSHRINLIDTPGHVDFAIEVERSIRVLDGAITILDAVSGVEAQTEAVWDQANKYHLARLVFINKLDREGANLLNVYNQIKSRLQNGKYAFFVQYPISSNKETSNKALVDLINLNYLEWEDKEGEMIKVIPYSVWRQTIKPFLPKSLISQFIESRQLLLDFLCDKEDEFMEVYFKNIEENGDDLVISNIPKDKFYTLIRKLTLSSQMIPIFCGASLKNWGVQTLLDGVIKYLPGPLERNTELQCVPRDRMIGLAFKVICDDQKGPMVFVRVYSGVLNSRAILYNSTKKAKERVSKIFQMFSNETVEIHHVSSGNIGVLLGLRHTSTGDTLMLDVPASYTSPVILDGITTLPTVFYCSIEANSLSDEDSLHEALTKLQLEDPSFKVEKNEESGQLLISGLGELHLDIIKYRLLNEMKVRAKVGKVSISYRESLLMDNPIKKSWSLNKDVFGKKYHIDLQVQFEMNSDHGGNEYIDAEKMMNRIDLSIVDKLETLENSNFALEELKNVLKDQFESALKRGPLLGFPTCGLVLTLKKISIYPDTTLPAIRSCISELICEVLKEQTPILLEPYMSVNIRLADDAYLGAILNDINSARRGQVNQIIANNTLPMDDQIDSEKSHPHHHVLANIPLKELIGYVTVLRSISAGTASFDMKMIGYKSLALNLQKEILIEHRGYL